MSTFVTGPPNFLVPGWMVSPIADPSTVRSGIKPRAIHRVMYLAKAWVVNADISWSVAGIDGNTYTNSGEAHVGDEPFSSPVLDELGLEEDWGGFSFSASGQYTFEDGAMNPEADLFTGSFGYAFQWIDERPDRANTWETDELELVGSVNISSPNDAYSLVDGVSEPSDIGFNTRNYSLPIAWQNGKPGEDFYGTASISDEWDADGYHLTFIANITVTPTEYWTWDGVIDATTGEVVPPL